jgi:hypothetical protein
MNKEFEYRGFKFHIKVEFNTKTERRLDGETWHTIIVNCMDFDNYYVKEEVNDKLLELFIHDCERIAKKYIDEKLEGKTTVNARLSKLGFK